MTGLRYQCGETLNIERGDSAFIGRDSYSHIDVYKRQVLDMYIGERGVLSYGIQYGPSIRLVVIGLSDTCLLYTSRWV